ncbi:MAG: phage/plasmid primase, P4 family, partial [Syntrophomonadaceae bacterium]|nr:phage/plasmid primase, P4 family [Syntrophomonadaceae bacterium]
GYDEWEAAASLSRHFQHTLRHKAQEKGWELDGTADLARVLRPPGTFNNKLEPVEVVILEDNPAARYNPEDFGPYMLEYEELPYWDGTTGEDFPPAVIDPIIKGCQWMRHCRDNADRLPEPEWYALLSVLACCENGNELAHEWSKPYPGYSPEETDRKFNQSIKASGPRTCQYIRENLNVEYCSKCKRKVKSPAVLGLPKKRAYFDEQGTFIPAWLAEDLMVEYYIKNAASDFWIYENGVYRPGGDKVLAAAAQRKLGTFTRTSRIRETLDFIRRASYTELPKPNRNFINVRNGRLEWRTGKLYSHSPGTFEIVQLPVNYDPAATCPVFDRYLETTLDKDAAQLAIEIIGYCLIPDTRYEKAFMLTGSGRNGKSIFLSVIDNLIGTENVSHIALQDLEENKFKAAGLLGKLVNTFADLDSRALKSTTLLKMLTSGDPIDAEKKFKDGFTFTNYARLIFSANTIPRTSDTTFAFYERWVILPFERVFDVNNPNTDPGLREKLSAPEELSGILNKALIGLQNLYLLGGFTQPASVRAALSEYKKQNDSVLAFCDECVEPGRFVSKAAFYNAYKMWCEQQGLRPVSQKRLKPSLLQSFPNVTEARDGNYGSRGWVGIQLNDEAPSIIEFGRYLD